ncbi:putative F-box associated interaction domain-containing protein [Helianthus annuus]|nr:putative F-box associated interaction domain-containing protein [Helianthus annuus]
MEVCYQSSCDFIACYSRHQQQQHLLLRYHDDFTEKYVSVVDDDSFSEQRVSLTAPLLVNTLKCSTTIGSSHGLLCSYSLSHSLDALIHGRCMAVISNPSVGKGVGVVVPNFETGIYKTSLGFGVCRETTDPKIVKVTHITNSPDIERITSIPRQVEVFTLSKRAWRPPYSSNLPRKSIRFFNKVVVVDGVLYWLATDRTPRWSNQWYNLIVSFDMTSEEFREVNLPDSLADSNMFIWNLSIYKIRESIAVLECDINVVWVMENGVSKTFTKLFTIDVNMPHASLIGFRKSGELIIQIYQAGPRTSKYVVYEPYSKHIDDVEFGGMNFSLCVPYMETLLLLDQPNFTVYDDMETLQLPSSFVW